MLSMKKIVHVELQRIKDTTLINWHIGGLPSVA